MSDELVTIEVDGKSIQARPGSMLIEATDAAGIYIPRFCYHKHLSIAANCRMCLVEVERAPKPLPACATPVMDGMKVFTRSENAVDAQRSTMEFLLINHPLDCPICDQGGECELQDLAMGYGGDVSRYTERKRVVRDKDIGPLVQTDMTRCIHCTRCVRFGEEVAGLRELGATGRGEDMEIGTYVANSMKSELSGNVIDLCPVGALTSKPYRYSARAWELQQRNGIAPHDCLGSNVHFHVKGSTVKRIVPMDNPDVNETWLSDRDRFSYEALNHEDRLLKPQVKRDGEWQDCDWDVALDIVAQRLGQLSQDDQGEQLGVLVSPSSTTEECYLAQRLARELGSNNIDHRLRQADFSSDALAPLAPGLGCSLDDLESADAIVLIGANTRLDQPLINHRIRKAALRGARIITISPVSYEFNFILNHELICRPSEMIGVIGGISKALAEGHDDTAWGAYTSDDAHREIAATLKAASSPVVLTGNFAQRHESFGQISAIAALVAEMAGGTFGQLTDGANAAGAWLAGAIPHRGPAGRKLSGQGTSAAEMFGADISAFVLMGVEPDTDCLHAQRATESLRNKFVVSLSAFTSPSLETVADVMLPIAAYAENEGSYVNAVGHWQSFKAAVKAPGEARPAWKLLRVLGERLSLPGFDAVTIEEISTEVSSLCDSAALTGFNTKEAEILPPVKSNTNLEAIGEVPNCATDALVRRAECLQAAAAVTLEAVTMNAATAKQLGLKDGAQALVRSDGGEAIAVVAVDENIPAGSFVVNLAHAGAATYSGFPSVQVSKA